MSWRRVGCLGLALFALLGCTAVAAPEPNGRIRVVAAENFWGDIARQIGGRQVAVTSVLKTPNTDPHDFTSNPIVAADVSSAQLVIGNGVSYDPWLTRLLATGSSVRRRVLIMANALRITGANPNPHLWYWTARLPTVAAAIASQLCAIRRSDCPQFTANVNRFDRSLQPLHAMIDTIRQRFAGTPIAYTERVPGYLVSAAGLRLRTPVSFSLALENGSEPSAADTAAFDAALTDHKVRVLLYNAQVVDAQTTHFKQLAAAAGVPVVGVTETMPPNARDFQSWQLEQDRALLRALETGR